MSYRTVEFEHAVVLEPVAAAAAVIWLHGLGADGRDFVPIVPELGLPATIPTRFIFPHAPVRAVTINNGFRMRAWYDVRSRDKRAFGASDAAGLAESVAAVHALIGAQRAAGIAAERIVVAGFSQGGAVALHSALTAQERLAGLLALSTYLPQPKSLAARLAPANATLPIMLCHGAFDDVLPLDLGLEARDWLTERGYPVAWHEYRMGHSVSPAEIADVGHWLRARLA